MAYGPVNTPGTHTHGPEDLTSPVPADKGGSGQNTLPKSLYAFVNGSTAMSATELSASDAIPVADASAATGKKITITNLKAALGLGFRLKVTFGPEFSGKSYTASGGGETYTGSVPSGLTDIITVGSGNTTYKVTATGADGTACSVEITTGPKEGQYEGELRCAKVYGAAWDGTSTTRWTRTDDAAMFADPVPYVAGAKSYGSPFDNIQPWAGMVKSERTGGTMVAIPKFWYKLTKVGDGLKVQIADRAIPGFSVSPAHMNRGDGKGERNVVYIGRYHCAASNYKSVTGQSPKETITRSAARTAIHNLGANIWSSDLAMRFTIWLLYIVEFADWNSQKCIGHGCGDDDCPEAMGYTDTMPYHTGTTLASREDYGAGTQYRNIEGLWDNVYDWCDGCYNNASGLNVILNPANFSDTTGGTLIGKPSSGWPGGFNVSSTGGFPMIYPSKTGGSGTTYSCDCWNFDASSPCVYVGGNYSQNENHGLLYVNYNSVSNANDNIGARFLLGFANVLNSRHR